MADRGRVPGAEGVSQKAPRLAIRDAASLLIVDTASGTPRILMGRRQDNHIFLPGKWVFPGGRLDADDLTMARALPSGGKPGGFDQLALKLRQRPSASQADTLARALALAAIRETFEETGLMIAGHAVSGGQIIAGTPKVWNAFVSFGMSPAIDRISFFARAITPPGRTRRYDTRFFLCGADAIADHRGPRDDEFAETGWFTFLEMVALDTASVTRSIIEDARRAIEPENAAADVPFYRTIGGTFRRTLLG